jgi:hypothetical protein
VEKEGVSLQAKGEDLREVASADEYPYIARAKSPLVATEEGQPQNPRPRRTRLPLGLVSIVDSLNNSKLTLSKWRVQLLDQTRKWEMTFICRIAQKRSLCLVNGLA